MTEKMTFWGVGPQLTLLTLIFSAAVFLINICFFPSWQIILYSRWINGIVGGGLIAFGIPVWIGGMMAAKKHFSQGKLCTSGIFAYIRHPVYGAWIVLIIPGLVIITGRTLGLLVPFFMYGLFRLLIAREEEFLQKKFGQAYFNYRTRVGAVFPKWFPPTKNRCG